MNTAILQAGNPILRQKSQPVASYDITSTAVKDLISTLIEVMHQNQGVGIAAPQIGINQRIFIYGFTNNPRYPDQAPIPLTVMINPAVIKCSSEQELAFEGCLSLGTLRGEVQRASNLTVAYYNEDGQHCEKTVSGFEARIIQHEMDHLNGILIIERMPNFNNFGFAEELIKNTSVL